MRTIEKMLPAGFRWSELALAELVNNSATLPSSVAGGHKLTLIGARNGTTAHGVHFTGAATSNAVVAAAAAQNAQAACNITIRFKLDQTFAAGAAADVYLFNKAADANNYIRIRLESTDGKLYWEQGDGAGANQFQLTSTTVSWTAGTWYTVTCSLTDAPAQRLIVNGTAEDTDTAVAVATPNGGDMVFMSSSDGGTDGAVGVVSMICIGVGATAAVALTAAQESALSQGMVPPTAKVQYLFVCDEGVGVTLVDRGSAAGNATLDSACTWSYGKCKAACISVDNVNDYLTASSLDISGDITILLAEKVKSTYNALSLDHGKIRLRVDASNVIEFYYKAAGDRLQVDVTGAGTMQNVVDSAKPAIDDYKIWGIVSTLSTGGVALYRNGAVVQSTTGAGQVSAGAATLLLCTGTSNYDPNKTLLFGIVRGAMSAAQVKAVSREIDQWLNMGIGV